MATRTKSKYLAGVAFTLTASFGLVSPLVTSTAWADTSVFYDFNTSGDLTNNFNSYVSYGTIVQSNSGGIGNTGAINVSSGSADAVYTTKSSYSIGPVGSTYTFTCLLKSVGNSGYSGMGFTALNAGAGNSSGSPYRPTDALGLSVHGGGFVLHNGSNSDIFGNWQGGAAGVQTIKDSAISDLLNSGSPDQWYKIIFKLTRDSATTFDARIEVWPTNSSGTELRASEADAIYEWLNVTNTNLINAPSIYSYINFSGYRVTHFDNYRVDLAGGSTVVAAGMPVVLTNSATNSAGVVSFAGNVTSAGGGTVTERGFAYATTASPNISDNKVASGSGTGSFSGTTSALANGTYYFRAYATNATGTTYGSDIQVVITDSSGAAPSSSPTPEPSSSSAGTNSNVSTSSTGAQTETNSDAEQLARTGAVDSPLLALALILLFFGYTAYSIGFEEMRKAKVLKWLGLDWLDFKFK